MVAVISHLTVDSRGAYSLPEDEVVKNRHPEGNEFCILRSDAERAAAG
jgi:hypothetical protein